MQLSRFAKFAWSVLAFNLLVILWGAYVRASGSGAGCGGHWPLCNGEVIPRTPTIATLIEYSHRLTSGLALVLVAVALLWAFRAYPAAHPVRRGAALSMFFMLTEALVGAGLVLLQYVADNQSLGRAVWISGHLINTFLLVAALTFTAWAATTGSSVLCSRREVFPILLISAVSALVLGVSGAVTALGATLFPVTSLADGLRQDFSPLGTQLMRLRVIHPALALAVGALLIHCAMTIRRRCPGGAVVRYSRALIALVEIQLVAGLANLLLHAPIWLQIIHLLLSDLIWILFLLLAYSALAHPHLFELEITAPAPPRELNAPK
jgi:heme A synthase